jgi:putative redox protein
MPSITTRYLGDMTFESTVGSHRMVIDVPTSMGGADRGPTPPELFVASLGSCVAAFVAQYCERTGLDTTDLAVDVAFEKAEDPTRLINLQVTIRLPHAECHDREAAIRRVAEHCPVHASIASFDGLIFQILDRTNLAVGAGAS